MAEMQHYHHHQLMRKRAREAEELNKAEKFDWTEDDTDSYFLE